MSLKKVLTFALALFITGGGLQAQKLIVGADFTTRFDNREYANNDFNESQTLFSARLTPRIGVEWMDKNRLIVGVDLLQNFGDDTKFLSKARPSAYYQFNSRNVQANAGIFDRKELLGDYSLAFFGDSTAFYHNRLSGFLGHYKSTGRRNTYVEMAIDWEGMYSEESREMFRIISAGRYTLDKGFYFGYAFSMFHFAGKIGNENADGQPAGQSLCGLGVQRLLRLRHQGGLSVRTPAGAQHRVGMEKAEGRPDRLRHDQMGRETRKQPLSG